MPGRLDDGQIGTVFMLPAFQEFWELPTDLYICRYMYRVPTNLQLYNSYLSIPKFYCVNFSVFAVDARCGDVNFHRGAPSRGLEWAGFEAASATGPAGRHTVHFPTTLPFSKPILRMTPIYVIFDISRWREYYASGVGCY